MGDAHKLLKLIRGENKEPVSHLIGTIPTGYTSGWPTIQFDGESTVGSRTYPHMSSYTPTVGDRVLIAVVGDGGVILGKII